MEDTRTAAHVAAIYNAAWMVRNYYRGARTTTGREQRAEAIRQLGLVIRRVFATSDDFEPLLIALFDGLSHSPPPPF